MIEEQQATVFYAPTRGRRYFSRRAAVKGEANAKIFDRYPIEPFESDTGHHYDIRYDEPERYEKMLRRLSRLINNEVMR